MDAGIQSMDGNFSVKQMLDLVSMKKQSFFWFQNSA